MTKTLVIHFLIVALLCIGLQEPIFAQTQPASNINLDSLEQGSAVRSDFRKMLDEKAKEFQKASKEFDPQKAAKDDRSRQAKPDHWSKKKTVLVVLLATIGAAIGIYFLAKYAKDCIRTNYPDCNPYSDEGCVCEEYAKKK